MGGQVPPLPKEVIGLLTCMKNSFFEFDHVNMKSHRSYGSDSFEPFACFISRLGGTVGMTGR